MEPYACMVAIDEAGRIQVWANNKQPFRLRWQLASALGLPRTGYGSTPVPSGGTLAAKPAPWMPLAYALAQRVGRPVKMIMDYVEELMAGNPGHPSVITIKSGVKHDGQLGPAHPGGLQRRGLWGFRGALTLSGGARRGAGPIAFPTFGSRPP